MWSDLVVIPPPFFDNISGMFQAEEPFGIQALVMQPPDEALSVGILYRLAGPDEIQLQTFSVRPLIKGSTGKLRHVIHNDDSDSPLVSAILSSRPTTIY